MPFGSLSFTSECYIWPPWRRLAPVSVDPCIRSTPDRTNRRRTPRSRKIEQDTTGPTLPPDRRVSEIAGLSSMQVPSPPTEPTNPPVWISTFPPGVENKLTADDPNLGSYIFSPRAPPGGGGSTGEALLAPRANTPVYPWWSVWFRAPVLGPSRRHGFSWRRRFEIVLDVCRVRCVRCV